MARAEWTARVIGSLLLAAAPMPLAAQPIPAAEQVAAHARVISLEGGQNFRDLGGYRTSDGRHVKWALIYRSGSMHNLTPSDFQALKARGVRTVFDFRSSDERSREPVAWPAAYAPSIHEKDYALDMGDLAKVLAKPDLSATEAIAAGQQFYGQLPYQFADQYRAMFAALLAGQTPLVFNCSAGKDRTGVAAALLLTALGVPRATATEDYLLSNKTFDPRKSLATDARADASLRRLPPEFMKMMMGVDARLLDAAFRSIESRPGGMPAYFKDELGLTPIDLARLRTMYLE